MGKGKRERRKAKTQTAQPAVRPDMPVTGVRLVISKLEHPGWGTAVSAILAFGATLTPGVVRVLCLIAFVGSATYTFSKTDFGKEHPGFRVAMFFAAMLLAGVLFSSARFFDEPEPILTEMGLYDLTPERRQRFLELIRNQTEPRDTLKVGCVAWSEAACVAAGRFLILLSEAGWRIDANRVHRMDTAIPIDGAAITSRVESAEENLPPHMGTWDEVTPSQLTFRNAFRQIEIPVQGQRDDALPEGTTGIYFGPEPMIMR